MEKVGKRLKIEATTKTKKGVKQMTMRDIGPQTMAQININQYLEIVSMGGDSVIQMTEEELQNINVRMPVTMKSLPMDLIIENGQCYLKICSQADPRCCWKYPIQCPPWLNL